MSKCEHEWVLIDKDFIIEAKGGSWFRLPKSIEAYDWYKFYCKFCREIKEDRKNVINEASQEQRNKIREVL